MNSSSTTVYYVLYWSNFEHVWDRKTFVVVLLVLEYQVVR